MIYTSLPALMVNCSIIMKSSDLNGGYWTVSDFHKQLANTAQLFVPKYLHLISPTFPYGKGKTWRPCQNKGVSNRDRTP